MEFEWYHWIGVIIIVIFAILFIIMVIYSIDHQFLSGSPDKNCPDCKGLGKIQTYHQSYKDDDWFVECPCTMRIIR